MCVDSITVSNFIHLVIYFHFLSSFSKSFLYRLHINRKIYCPDFQTITESVGFIDPKNSNKLLFVGQYYSIILIVGYKVRVFIYHSTFQNRRGPTYIWMDMIGVTLRIFSRTEGDQLIYGYVYSKNVWQ